MPSDKKRINLTIPDNVYERLQVFKADNGITNDATACLQLVVQQLNAQEQGKIILNFVQNSSLEQLTQMSDEGLALMMKEAERKKLP